MSIKKTCAIFLSFLFVILFSISTPVLAKNHDRVDGQILVKFKESTSEETVTNELVKHEGRELRRIDRLRIRVVSVPQGKIDRILADLSKNPFVEYAEPDYIATVSDYPQSDPNDPNFANRQWGLANTGQTIGGQIGTVGADSHAKNSWPITTGTTIKVAVLDTGIDASHPDLSSKLDLQKDFTTSGSVDDLYGHGTHVAGIIAATTNNGIGVAGICPECRLLNGKVLDNSGSGAYSWIANGITWATDNGAKVINLSLGGSSSSSTLQNAVNYAWTHGAVVVAAAGNNASSSKIYPAAYPNVISVASTNNRDKKSSFSNYGSWVTVAAPGEYIYSTLPTHSFKLETTSGDNLSYGFLSGTSMATPMTAGVAALVWSSPFGTNNGTVVNRLKETADTISGTGTYWTYGRIDAAGAVGSTSSSTTPTVTSTPTSTPIPTQTTSSPTPTPTITPNPINGAAASVSSVTYSLSGGFDNRRNLNITVRAINNLGNPVSNASVSLRLTNTFLNRSWTGSATTGSSGTVTLILSNAPTGTYTTSITNLTATGLTWDAVTPPNSFTK